MYGMLAATHLATDLAANIVNGDAPQNEHGIFPAVLEHRLDRATWYVGVNDDGTTYLTESWRAQ